MTQVAAEVPKAIQDVLDNARNNNPVDVATPPATPPASDTPAPATPAEKPAEKPAKSSDTPPATPVAEVELTDDQLIEMLKKRNITLPPPEEKPKEQSKEEARNEAITWALSNKVIDITDVEDYGKVKKESPVELAFQAYKESRKGEVDDNQEELTEETLRQDFEDEFFLYEEDGDPRKERAMKRLKKDAENFIKEKFGKMDSIESEYKSSIQQAERAKIISSAKEDVVTNGISFVHKDDDGTEINVKIPVNQKIAEEISASLAKSNVQLNPEDGVDPTDYLKRIFNGALLASNPASFMHEYATAYHAAKLLRYEASGRGIEHKQTVVQANLGDVPDPIRKVLEEARARQTAN